MKTKLFPVVFLLMTFGICKAQSNPFHTLTYPTSSPQVVEMQKLGVTEIEINYHSPAVRDRDVWNTPDIIPQNGEPIPWRAGANMNTTISFSTDVKIDGEDLKAGTYGFHVIPKGDTYTLLFAHNSNLWGSYYLDLKKDITLSIEVQATSCEKTEQLDFEFFDRTENSVVIGLEWDTKQLPFTVSVDLEETVVESFRNELRGINTYRWEAWNDAANWCLQQETNLEEALAWANRSIDGGYNGFAADKNLNNLTTKARLLKKLDRNEELSSTIDEAIELSAPAYQFNSFIIFLLSDGYYDKALAMSTKALNEHPDTWYLQLNLAICQYFNKKKGKKTFQLLEKAHAGAPEGFKARITEIKEEIKNNTYTLTSR